jgi:hypothetical protein
LFNCLPCLFQEITKTVEKAFNIGSQKLILQIDGNIMQTGLYLRDYEIQSNTIIKIMEKPEARGKQRKDLEHPR